MLCYQTTYGEDVDGNRGTVITEYELEPDDIPIIVSTIVSSIIEAGDYSLTYDISLYCHIIEDDVEVPILLVDYLPQIITSLLDHISTITDPTDKYILTNILANLRRLQHESN